MKLHSRHWGAGERVAVLVHGMMADTGCWWQVGPALAERGYRVVAVDLPGHGHSPRSDQATVELFASSLVESVPAGAVDPVALAAQQHAATASRTLEFLRANRSWWNEGDMIAEVEAAKLWDVATAVSLSVGAGGRDLTPATAVPSLMVRADPSLYVSPEFDVLRSPQT